MRLVVDGDEIDCRSSETVLALLRRQGIWVPTLCHEGQLEPFGSCWLCLVEQEGKGVVPACATRVADGMRISTRTPRVEALRRMALDLFLSDHYGDCLPPCQRRCPAGLNPQGYIAYIASHQYREAVALVKERTPLVATLGRVCPRPCEEDCRRNRVDEPVAICALKRYAADQEIFRKGTYRPRVGKPTGKRIAVVGSGPAGLTCAYFLARLGHKPVIFEALPEPGGMLRYAIPRYRLPKEVLDREIELICELGVKIETGRRLGRDIELEGLRSQFDAIFLGLGAQLSQRLGAEGEELSGVVSGLDFLRMVAAGERLKVGPRVGVVGGGNTAVDAARTALRLGASEVVILYRRSRKEMPAHPEEVAAAEAEGVRLKVLVAPKRVIPVGNRVGALECLEMRLGEPDSSGRRRPEPIPGSEFVIPLDTIITAIGQVPDLTGLDGLDRTRWETLQVREPEMETNLSGVFAAGDLVSGAATVVEACAGGRRAALAIDQYLRYGRVLRRRKAFDSSKGGLSELDPIEFEGVERRAREEVRVLDPKNRVEGFDEVELGFSSEAAQREAQRCLECGCKDLFECGLRRYATLYRADGARYKGEAHHYRVDGRHPFIEVDLNKCIRCGRCIRSCEELRSLGALGFAHRGFDVVMAPELERPLLETSCESCGQCVDACPVGALTEKALWGKPGPFREKAIPSICGYCSVGCKVYLCSASDRLVRIKRPQEDGDRITLCLRGKFGFGFVNDPGRLRSAFIRSNGKLEPTTPSIGVRKAAQLIKGVKERYGGSALAVIASPRLTIEELYLARRLAQDVIETPHLVTFTWSETLGHLPGYIGQNRGELADLDRADFILILGSDLLKEQPVVGVRARLAHKSGARVWIVNPEKTALVNWADHWIKADDYRTTITELTHRAQTELSREFWAAGNPVVLYNPEELSPAEISQVHRLGELRTVKLIPLLAKCNQLGWLGLGLGGSSPLEILDRMRGGGLKGALILGEDPVGCAIDPEFVQGAIGSLDLLVVQDLFLTPTAQMAQVVLPGCSFAESSGHFVNLDLKVQPLSPALPPLAGISNLQLISQLARELGKGFDYKGVKEITEELKRLSGMAGWDQGRISFERLRAEEVPAVEKKEKPLFRCHCDAVERWFAETAQRLGIHF